MDCTRGTATRTRIGNERGNFAVDPSDSAAQGGHPRSATRQSYFDRPVVFGWFDQTIPGTPGLLISLASREDGLTCVTLPPWTSWFVAAHRRWF